MKRLSLPAITCFLLSVHAVESRDLTRGTIELGGSTGVSYGSHTQTPEGGDGAFTITTVFAGTDLTFYVAKNIGAGLSVSYERVSADFGESDLAPAEAMSLAGLLIGPQAKYSFPISDRANLFATGSAGVERVKQTETEDGIEEVIDKTAGFFWSAGGGARFFVGDSASIDASVRYHSSHHENGEVFDLSGLIVQVGVSVFVNRRDSGQ